MVRHYVASSRLRPVSPAGHRRQLWHRDRPTSPVSNGCLSAACARRLTLEAPAVNAAVQFVGSLCYTLARARNGPLKRLSRRVGIHPVYNVRDPLTSLTAPTPRRGAARRALRMRRRRRLRAAVLGGRSRGRRLPTTTAVCRRL